MLLDAVTYGHDLADVPAAVRAAQESGYAGWFTSEVAHDPFLALALAAEHSTELEVGSAIAVAFARNPMTVAYAAQDLQRLSGGRLVLGLGSQVMPHITRRFSMPWSRPTARMREFVLALRAIWASWNEGADLRFEGELYRHTLMTPFFAPPPVERAPRVWVAAVGPRMTTVAGEVADGVLCHGFTSVRFVRGTTLPALEDGIARAGRHRGDLTVAVPAMVITGYTDEEVADAEHTVRTQIGFYGSTPAYRRVLEAHGWGELGDELHALSRSDGWDAMPGAIPAEVVDAFAVRASPDELGAALLERWGGVADRVSLSESVVLRPDDRARLRDALDGT